jgi:transcriptional regulator with XRE-family HTH domain
MPRSPKPKSSKNALRLLRGLLSEHGEDLPVSQFELAKLVGISIATVRAIESGDRALTDAVLWKTLLKTGAYWKESEQQWVCAEAMVGKSVPFSREFYSSFKRRSLSRPTGADEIGVVLGMRLSLLLRSVSDKRWFEMLFRVDRLLDLCQKEFGIENPNLDLMKPGRLWGLFKEPDESPKEKAE